MRLTRLTIGFLLAASTLLPAASAAAATRPDAPVVTMKVTLPDGRTEEVTAGDSEVATIALKDGVEYQFRPTVQDSSPWTRIVVAIFRAATTTAPTQIVGEVEVKSGGPAVDSKTTPAFKIAVPKVSPPAAPAGSTD